MLKITVYKYTTKNYKDCSTQVGNTDPQAFRIFQVIDHNLGKVQVIGFVWAICCIGKRHGFSRCSKHDPRGVTLNSTLHVAAGASALGEMRIIGHREARFFPGGSFFVFNLIKGSWEAIFPVMDKVLTIHHITVHHLTVHHITIRQMTIHHTTKHYITKHHIILTYQHIT